MKSRTGGIIGTIASVLLCGIPGAVLACVGLIAIVGGQSPQVAGDNAQWQSTLLGAVIFLGGGALLMVIPLVVGFFGLRRRPDQTPPFVSTTAPIRQSAPAPAPAAVPTAIPAPQPTTQAAPELAAVEPAAPVASAARDASAQVVYDRIMALNRPTAPYQIVDGAPQHVDLVAEWKIVDAQWYEIFAKANLTKVFRIHMKLDPARREVRAQDQEFTVSWRAGVPSLSFQASAFRGQQTSISFGSAYAFTENLAPGQVYNYRFSTNELKKPIQEAVAACGWTYKGVAFGKL